MSSYAFTNEEAKINIEAYKKQEKISLFKHLPDFSEAKEKEEDNKSSDERSDYDQ